MRKVSILSFILLAGCSGSSGLGELQPSPTPSPSPSPSLLPTADFAEFLHASAQAYCDVLVRCGYYPTSQAGQCTDATFALNESGGQLSELQAVASGRLGYNAAAAPACIEALRTLSQCSSFGYQGSACDAVRVPLVAPGGACSESAECIGGWCQVDASCEKGICIAFIADGQPCDVKTTLCDSASGCRGGVCSPLGNLNDACASRACRGDFACRPTKADGTNLTCQLLANEGDFCLGNGDCTPGMVCSLQPGSSGTCVHPTPGMSCTNRDCGELACIGGSCLTWVEPGQSCTTDSDGLNNCRGFGCASGVCMKQPALGDDCTGNCLLGSDCMGACLFHTYCDPNTNKCEAPGAFGSACTLPPSPSPTPPSGFGPCWNGVCDSYSLTCVPVVSC